MLGDMDFMILKSRHCKIDTARCVAIEAFSYLAYAAQLASEAGNKPLAENLERLGRETLALDFTIPPPKG